VRDVVKSLAVLDAIVEKDGSYSEDDIRSYVIYVHGLKSALANIGNMDLSAIALKLEQSGRDENLEIITSETPAFLDSLRILVEELVPQKESIDDEAIDEDRPYLRKELLAIIKACEEYDKNAADDVLAKLREKTWAAPTKELLGTISGHLLHSDFDEVVNITNLFLETR
jgi:HPt (histidine-containing phosphotransfer) domain-containing protein